MTGYRIECAQDPQDLARRAAQTISARIDLALDRRDRCQIALSGGSTPGHAYRLLGQERLPWERVDVVLGDERWVAACLLYTSPSPRDLSTSRMPSSA